MGKSPAIPGINCAPSTRSIQRDLDDGRTYDFCFWITSPCRACHVWCGHNRLLDVHEITDGRPEYPFRHWTSIGRFPLDDWSQERCMHYYKIITEGSEEDLTAMMIRLLL